MVKQYVVVYVEERTDYSFNGEDEELVVIGVNTRLVGIAESVEELAILIDDDAHKYGEYFPPLFDQLEHYKYFADYIEAIEVGGAASLETNGYFHPTNKQQSKNPRFYLSTFEGGGDYYRVYITERKA